MPVGTECTRLEDPIGSSLARRRKVRRRGAAGSAVRFSDRRVRCHRRAHSRDGADGREARTLARAPSISRAMWARTTRRCSRSGCHQARSHFTGRCRSTSRSARGSSKARFQVEIRRPATRGLIGQVVKAIVIQVAKLGLDKGVSLALPKLAEAFEKAAWKKLSLKEGWVRVTRATLATGVLETVKPVSSGRSLLLIHGTFTSAATEFCALGGSTFFERMDATYGDRIYAFNHFSVSRTPEQNARMMLESLPDQTTSFDVVAHSRGGLVLRNLVERSAQLGASRTPFQTRSRGTRGMSE